MSLKLFTWLGFAAVVSSAIVTVFVSIFAFLNPINSSSFDNLWAFFYFGCIVLVFFLAITRRFALLLKLIIGLTALLITTILLITDSRFDLLMLFLIILLSVGIGKYVLKKLSISFREHLFENILFAFSIGIGALAVIILVIASVSTYIPPFAIGNDSSISLLSPISTYFLLGCLSIIFLPGLLRSIKVPTRDQFDVFLKSENIGVFAVSASILFLCALGGFIWALAPSIRYDALTYHLGVPEIYIQAGRMVEVRESFNSYWSHYIEMIFTLALLVSGQPLPGLLHFTAGLAATGMVYSIGKRLSGTRVGLVAACIFYSIPLVNYESATVYIDLFLTLFIVGAYFAGFIWWKDGQAGWLVLSGIFAGLAVGSKLTAGPMLVPYGIMLVIGLLKRYKLSGQFWRSLFNFGFPAVLLLSPWLVRDWLWTSNPVFPIYNSFFHSPLWTGATWKGQDIFTFKAFSVERIKFFLTLPWTLTVETKRFYREGTSGMLAGVILLSIPWLYAWHPHLTAPVRKYSLGILVLSISAFLFTFNFATLARYAIPVYAMLSVLAALNIEIIWKFATSSRYKTLLSIALIALAFVYIFSTRLVMTGRGYQIPERYPYQVMLGFETQDDFLSRSLPVYNSLKYIDAQGNGEHKVLSIGNEFRFYTRSEIHGNTLSSDANILVYNSTREETIQALIRDAYDYLLIDWEYVRTNQLEATPILQPEFLDQYAELEFSRNNIYVYRLYPNGAMASGYSSHNLVSNAGFENVTDTERVLKWIEVGNPTVYNDKAHAHNGKHCLQVSVTDAVYQTIDIQGNTLYTLNQWVKANQPGQQARLQIVWLDEQSRLSLASIDVIPASENWEWHQMSVTAPEDAVAAQIYITAHDNSSVLIDDVCFAQGDSCAVGE